MNKPTRILSLLAFTSIVGCGWAQQEAKLKVVANDGEGAAIAEAQVNINSKLCFTQTGVGVVEEDVMTTEFKYADIASLSFKYDKVTGIATVDALEGLRLRNNPVAESLELLGLTENYAPLTVTDLKGAVRASIPEWKGEPINVSDLTPGLYFVTVNQKTFKFIKK